MSAREGAEAFDAAFVRWAPRLIVRPETQDDVAFLRDLFCRCSPLRDALPPQLLAEQALLQDSAFLNGYPEAMRRIVCAGPRPIGRIVVDWTQEGVSHGVDIAVDPDHRASGAGLHMLRAWLGAADALGKPCRLTVRADNPARLIYARLGFATAQASAEQDPLLVMARPVLQRRRSG